MKTQVQIKSVFEQIAGKVFTMTNTSETKNYIIEFITSKGIDGTDKQGIINKVNACKNVSELQRYVCNSLLMYEGMGLT
jgi:hypothetical protein